MSGGRQASLSKIILKRRGYARKGYVCQSSGIYERVGISSIEVYELIELVCHFGL